MRPDSEILRSLPNKLTLARIAAVPFLLILYPFDTSTTNSLCALIFLIAAFTDFFDGYLARKYQAETKLGALMDPIADKLIVTAALVLIASRGHLYSWVVALLLCREVAIAGLRLTAAEQQLTIKVSDLGKAKTLLMDAGICMLLLGETMLKPVGTILMWLTLIISYYSAYLYWDQFWQYFKKRRNTTESSQ